MNFNTFNKPVKSTDGNCKIKIKKTRTGKQIEFEGNCSSSQISIAKENLKEEEEIN